MVALAGAGGGGNLQSCPTLMMSLCTLPFEERACFVAGQAKSGTTLLVALLDNHPELLVLPEETAYFPTVLTKYAPRGRRAQFDYLTKQSLSNVLFGGPCKWGKRNYTTFPREKILVTIRDPRAILAAQIALEKTRKTGRFSTYYVIAHWCVAARLARGVADGEIPGFVVQYEDLVCEPAKMMEKVCAYLEIDFDRATVLTPTKVGQFWSGNSAARIHFSQISTEPVTRWQRELSEDEIGWVEWHCRDLMPEFGYEPRLTRRELRYFMRPIRGERPREYLKSRAYSLRDDWIGC